MKHPSPEAPIFEQFTVEQLANLTPYAESYLEDLAAGRQPIRPRFRRVVSRILGRPEGDLFRIDGGEPPDSTPSHEMGEGAAE